MAHDHAHTHDDALNPDGASDTTGRSELLRSRGLRVTASRLAVLDLLDHALEPMTHHDVVEALQQSPWNRSTLYRNLIDLTEVGLLIKSEIGGLARFERAGRLNPCAGHPHFVCTSCGTVSHLDDVSVHFAGRGPAAVMTGQVAVQLRGRCDDCE
jgi:Fur family ferric uptake transcriptional regulator